MQIKHALFILSLNRDNLFRAHYANCQDFSDYEKIIKKQMLFIKNKNILSETYKRFYNSLSENNKKYFKAVYIKKRKLSITELSKSLGLYPEKLFKKIKYFETKFNEILNTVNEEFNEN